MSTENAHSIAPALITSEQADLVASEVWRRCCQVLDDAMNDLRLAALAYSECSHEKWWVLETYARVFRDWSSIRSIGGVEAERDWNTWMEIRLPGDKNTRERVDMFVGVVEPFRGNHQCLSSKYSDGTTCPTELRVLSGTHTGFLSLASSTGICSCSSL
jgi:hypothetical protein